MISKHNKRYLKGILMNIKAFIDLYEDAGHRIIDFEDTELKSKNAPLKVFNDDIERARVALDHLEDWIYEEE